MTEEFNLSKRINKQGMETWDFKDGFIDAEDAKEFIRLLKTFELTTEGDNPQFLQGMSYALKFIKKRIDKLAGKKLI